MVVASLRAYAWWSYRSLGHALRTAQVEPFATVLEKAFSDFVVLKQKSDLQKSDLQTRATPLPGTLAAYEQNPEVFKSDAKLFEAWLKASQLATAVIEHSPAGSWVR